MRVIRDSRLLRGINVIRVVTGYEGILKDTLFSEKRGFYDAPIEVSISTEEENTSVRYTLDGSQPTVSRGQLYEGPVPITTTTTLRAIAFREGWRSSKVMTHSYIFVNDVARQPANPSGWPDNWGANGEVNRNDGSRNGILVSTELAIETLSPCVHKR